MVCSNIFLAACIYIILDEIQSQRTLSFHVGLLCALFCLRVDSAQDLIRILQSSHFPKRCVFVSIPYRILASLASLKVQYFWVSPLIPPISKARLKRRDVYVGLPLVPRQVPLLPGEDSFFPAMQSLYCFPTRRIDISRWSWSPSRSFVSAIFFLFKIPPY